MHSIALVPFRDNPTPYTLHPTPYTHTLRYTYIYIYVYIYIYNANQTPTTQGVNGGVHSIALVGKCLYLAGITPQHSTIQEYLTYKKMHPPRTLP